MPRIVDLSMATESDPSPLMNVKVTHLAHELGAIEDQKYYDIDPKDWPFPGKSYADDFVEMSSHAGTHMDAPYHYGPQTIPGGERPKYIDEVPLEWCFGRGVVIDIRGLPDAYEVGPQEIEAKLKDIGHELQPGDVALVMTGNDKLWGSEEYLTCGGHLGRDALSWILDHGIRLVGTDSWCFDRAYAHWSADYLKNGRDPKYLWPCHLLGLEKEYVHLEKMANLDQLPARGFTVYAFPAKIAQGTAGFVRAVAFVDE